MAAPARTRPIHTTSHVSARAATSPKRGGPAPWAPPPPRRTLSSPRYLLHGPLLSAHPLRLQPHSSMAMATSTFSPRPTSLRPLRAGAKPQLHLHLLSFPRRGSRLERAAAAGEAPVEVAPPKEMEAETAPAVASNGAAFKAVEAPAKAAEAAALPVPAFRDERWVNGTWDLSKFEKGGSVDWDAVIDAEARRRKWLEDYPEATNTDEAVVFDTSVIPWWAWMKRFHLPEAEKLNGRAAMVGFFMAYFVDSLTGVGLVDQMGNFFCKTLLFVAVAGVLLIRKNEDLDSLKKIIDETTFYDKQWQATWQDETTGGPKN